MCTIESNRSGEKPVGSLTIQVDVVENRGRSARREWPAESESSATNQDGSEPDPFFNGLLNDDGPVSEVVRVYHTYAQSAFRR